MQTRKKFCPETIKKITKGALIAFTGAGAIGLLHWVGALEISDPMLASFVVWLVPFATNVVKEWLKGN